MDLYFRSEEIDFIKVLHKVQILCTYGTSNRMESS
jgi:hypothetical protein